MKVFLWIILFGISVVFAILSLSPTVAGYSGRWTILVIFWIYLGFRIIRALPSMSRRLELKTDWFGAGKTQRLEREANAKLRDQQRKEDEAIQDE